jgi:hypothetical protein
VLALVLLGLMADGRVHTERPPRPSDEQLIQQLVEARPGARVLDQSGRDVLNGGRVICGRFQTSSQIEPFAAYAVWKESSRLAGVIISRNGPVPVEPDHWQAWAIGPVSDPDDGVPSSADRNFDTLQRRLALSFCPRLAPPEGVAWPTAQERVDEVPADKD